MNVETTGSDFKINCDKNVYNGYASIEVVCDITNLQNYVVISKDVSIANTYKAKTSTVLVWNKDAIIRTYCSEYKPKEVCKDVINNKTDVVEKVCYTDYDCSKWSNDYGKFESLISNTDKVQGLEFAPLETKQLKFIIDVPVGSTGKFDVLAGDTILDPWWDAAYSYRYQILENYTSELAKSVNDTDGFKGKIIWAKTWNESYLYAKQNDYTGDIGIANETDQKFWEEERGGLGNSPESVWDSSAKLILHMGEGTGSTFRDSTSNNNDGVWSGTNWTTGKFGNSTGFNNDVTKNITIPHSASLDIGNVDDYTVSAWFKFSSATVTMDIISKAGGGAYPFRINIDTTAGYIQMACYGSSATSARTTVAYNDNQWHNAVFVRDGGSLVYFYIDGKNYSAPKTDTCINAKNTAPVTIGQYVSGSPFTGFIDEVRIYNEVKSDVWVRQNYYNGLGNLTELGSIGGTIAIGNATITGMDYNITPYETFNNTHAINITTDNIASVTAYLEYDGTHYNAAGYNTSPTVWLFNRSVIPSLVTTNGESKYFLWNFTFLYPNGTSFVNVTTNQVGHSVAWAYYFAAPTANTTPTAGEAVRLSTTLTSLGTSATAYNFSGVFNNTAYATSGAYYFDATVPMVATTTTFSYRFGMTLTYGTTTLYRTSTDGSLSASPILLLTNGTGTPTLNFKYFKEESPYTPVNASHNLAITIWKSDPTLNVTYNFSFTKNMNHTIFISPVTADVYAFSIQEYENDGELAVISNNTYPERNYYLNGLHLTNVSQTVNLYLLNSTYADVIGMNVIDNLGLGMGSVIIDAQRYYPGENLYRTVARGYTDQNGEANMRLFKCTGESSVYHKFFLYKDYQIIGSYDQMCIIEDVVTFPVTAGSVVDYWNMYGDISGGCTWFNSTQLLVCDYTSGSSYNVELYVKQIQTLGATTKCNTTITASSGSLTCDLTGMTDEEYYYTFKATNSDGEVFIIDSDSIKNIGVGQYDNMGIFIAMLLFIGIAFIGWQNPTVMMILSVVGIIAGFAMGLYEVSFAGMASLLIAGAIILWGIK
jgi:hypothetical protein